MKTVLFLVFVSFAAADIKRRQNITVIGAALCKGEPVPNMLVSLKEKDWGSYDDILMDTLTDKYGEFVAYGEDNEMFDISPYVVFHHNCSVTAGCKGEATYTIPAEAIGGQYNLTVELSTKQESNKQIC